MRETDLPVGDFGVLVRALGRLPVAGLPDAKCLTDKPDADVPLLFRERIMDDLRLEAFFSGHLLQTSTHGHEYLDPSHHGGVRAAVLGSRVVERGAAHPMLPAQSRYRRTGLRTIQDLEDLVPVEPRVLHEGILGAQCEKIPPISVACLE